PSSLRIPFRCERYSLTFFSRLQNGFTLFIVAHAQNPNSLNMISVTSSLNPTSAYTSFNSSSTTVSFFWLDSKKQLHTPVFDLMMFCAVNNSPLPYAENPSFNKRKTVVRS